MWNLFAFFKCSNCGEIEVISVYTQMEKWGKNVIIIIIKYNIKYVIIIIKI